MLYPHPVEECSVCPVKGMTMLKARIWSGTMQLVPCSRHLRCHRVRCDECSVLHGSTIASYRILSWRAITEAVADSMLHLNCGIAGCSELLNLSTPIECVCPHMPRQCWYRRSAHDADAACFKRAARCCLWSTQAKNAHNRLWVCC